MRKITEYGFEILMTFYCVLMIITAVLMMTM